MTTNATIEFVSRFIVKLPLYKRFTIEEVCDLVCANYTEQTCATCLQEAVEYGLIKQEKKPAMEWFDSNGIAHVFMQSLYYRT